MRVLMTEYTVTSFIDRLTKYLNVWGGGHSTEVAFALPTQPSWVRFCHLTAGEKSNSKLSFRTCHSIICSEFFKVPQYLILLSHNSSLILKALDLNVQLILVSVVLAWSKDCPRPLATLLIQDLGSKPVPLIWNHSSLSGLSSKMTH